MKTRRPGFRTLLLLTGLIATFAPGATPARAQVALQDSLALVALYNATNGPSWTNSANWLSGPVASWNGVTVNAAGRVTRLNLASNNLSGSIPAEIGQLTELQRLLLQTNALIGSIPPQIGSLANLTQLTLFRNGLTGELPPQIGDLAQLTSLGLGENDLIGSIPAQIGQLQNLLQLDLNSNEIDGPLPPQMGNLTALQSLVIDTTALSGPIPLTFTALTALNTFRYDVTDLCNPDDPDFQAWLLGVGTVEGTGVTCPSGSITYTWTGAAGDNLWTTPGNWSPVGVPGPEDEAIIANGTALVETPVTVGALTVGSEVGVGTVATLGGTADVTVNGPLRWIGGGDFLGSGTVTALGASSVEGQGGGGGGGSAMRVEGRTVSLAGGGAVSFPSGESWLFTVGGGTLEVAGALTASGPAGGVLRFIGFDGTLRVTGGGGVTVAGGTLDIESALDNAGGGPLVATAGELRLKSGTTTTSGVTAGAGATITFLGGTYTAAGPVSVEGTLAVGGGSVNITGATTGGGTAAVSGGTLALSNSTFAPTLTFSGGTTTLAAPLTLDQDLVIGSGTFIVNAALTITGALTVGSEVGVGTVATLGGTADVTVNGPLRWIGGGDFLGSGTVTALGASSVEGQGGGGGGGSAMRVEGRTVSLAGGGAVSFPSGESWLFTVGGGTLEVAGALTASGPAGGVLRFIGFDGTLRVTGGGGVTVAGGTLDIESALDNAGELSVESSAMLSLEGVLANSGTLGGSGTLTVSNATLFTNTGTVAPGLSAAVAILPVGIPSGSLPFGPDGRLEVELGGLEPGTGYDRLAVGGAVALGGELALSVLDGFTPELGQTFEVLTFTSSTGDFDAYTGTSLGNGTGLAPSFTETSLVLTVVPDGNNPPIANADTASTPAGVPVLIDVLANDTDPDGDALLLAGVRPPANGTAEVADDAVRYTPSAGFAGTDSFTYTVSDGNGGADTDTVTVTVIPAPNVPPVAVDDAAAVAVNGTVLIDVLANDSDEDGDALVLEGVEPPVNGTGEVADGEVRYTPNSGFEGTDSFTYAVGDGNGGFDVATVTVVVTDLPYVLTGPEPGAQMGVDDDIEIYVGQVPVFIDNNGFAGLFGPLAFEAQPGDSLRVVAIDRGICQGLTPFYLTVVATGEQVALDSVGVNYQTGCISGPTIFYDSTFVLPSDPAGNTPPVAVADTAAVAANGSVLIDVLANDFDLDGDTLDLFDTSGPGNGTAEPEGEMVRYTPNAGFVGTDSFTYVVGDGNGGIGMGMVTVTVSSAANTPPVAVDDAAETQAAVTVFIDVLANDSDADGDTLRIEGFTLPENGTAVVAGGLFRYAPRAGFVGTDSFFYTVGDGNGGLDEATVTVTVTEGSGPVPGTCTPGLASADLAVNDVSARLYTTGSLFYDEGSGGQYLVPQASGIAPIFAAGVWIGGQVGGELRTAASTYASGVADPEFWPGPLGDDGRPVDPDDCAAFDRIYSVDRSAITAYESTGVASDDLAGWPVGLGAPAVDADGAPIAATSLDQTLDLEAGERPVLFGSRVSFWVMNDVGNVHTSSGRPPIGLEVRALAFSFDDADAALDQSTLYRYELVNKGGAPLEEARFSLFLDPDVGGALDDYVGSDPARGLGFAYNADADDDLYGSPPPAVGVDLFQGTGSFAYYSNDVGAATGDPTFGVGATYYNYMRGVWSDGTPITEGGTGYRSGGPVTPYAFPGDPEGEAFWSEVNADGAGGDTPPDDRRFVLSAPSFALAPGASQTFDFAILFATGADHLNSVTALKQASDRLQALYDTGDLYREASEEASVEVVAPPQTAAGSGFSVGVAVTGFVPTVAELRYRPVGATGYGSTPLTVSGDGYEGAIPNAAVTLRGVEYYVFLSNGARTITFPADEPETNPLRVRVGVAQQASSVMLPGDASAVTAYRMVSVPLVLDDPSPLAVFGDDYGDYGPTSWRLLRYLPLAERYAEFPDLNAAVVPGAAFWLAAYAEASGSFDVENGLSVDASEPVLLTLAPGWNQIGTPFAFPVAWDAVLGSETDGIQTPDFWDGTQYVERAVLDPWVGYFVLNGTEETVTLRVPPTEAGQTRSATRPAAKEGEEGYRLRLLAEARDRGLRDTQNLLGFADGAAEGRDRLDRAEPPPITTHLRLSAVEDGVRLGRSFRPAGTDGAAWELEVTATPDVLDAGPLAVRVALEEVGGRPDGYDVHVLDLDREVPLTLLESAFELTLSAARPVQRLRLIAGTDGFADAARGGISLAPVAFALAPAYPNPFAGTTTLAYELPEPADVTLDVFDLLGRRVAVLADGVQEAGRYTARWDGTVAGAPAANGVYVYRLRAGGFTASHKMVLLR